MIGVETLNTRYYFELNGKKLMHRVAYDFDSEKKASEYFLKNIQMYRNLYGENVNNFILVREEIIAMRKMIRRMEPVKYIIGVDTEIGELYVGMTTLNETEVPYLSPIKSDILNTNYFTSKELAESVIDEYKIALKPYYKETILNNLKVIKVEEEVYNI
jgi:hypothetical protein|uniref:Uncharacterized protein n=1 Tax=Myoviridae sp. ctcyQ27 TaxID=2825139 RepID=A0A8S5UFD7_9CAUD|nr:MAG TPA: hypothetical protein [Myoviridae sp. ctcyQ27]